MEGDVSIIGEVYGDDLGGFSDERRLGGSTMLHSSVWSKTLKFLV